MHIPDDLRQKISIHFDVEAQEILSDTKLEEATNDVYTFELKNRTGKYLIRKPANSFYLNRQNEKAVYEAVKSLGISDEVLYFDDEGIKISVFFENSCYIEDATETLPLLRKLHTSGIKVNHSYRIENLKRWTFPGATRPKQLENIQNRIDELISYLASLEIPQVLCHGDACTLNCLRLSNGALRLIDWEQAGMADPIVDIAIAAVHMGLKKSIPACTLSVIWKENHRKKSCSASTPILPCIVSHGFGGSILKTNASQLGKSTSKNSRKGWMILGKAT
jgi:thiamine kinase-like enzyme